MRKTAESRWQLAVGKKRKKKKIFSQKQKARGNNNREVDEWMRKKSTNVLVMVICV